MPRALLYLLTTASLLAACTGSQGSADGSLTDQEKRSFQLADSMAANGNLPDAQSMYEELAKYPESRVQADLALASIAHKQGRYEDAVTVLQDAQKQKPGNSTVLTQLGYALIAAGHPEDAVNTFDELIAMQPDNASFYNAKAVAFDKSGNHVAAQEIYDKALSLEPNSLSIRNNLAMSYILNGQPDDAINLLEPLVKNKTANPTMRQNLALAYGIKGDHSRAMELNLQDVTPEQAKENMRFYEKYAQAQREHAATNLTDRVRPVAPNDNNHDVPLDNAPAKKDKAPRRTPVERDESTLTPPPEVIPDAADTHIEDDAVPPPPSVDATSGNDHSGSLFGSDAVYQYPGQH